MYSNLLDVSGFHAQSTSKKKRKKIPATKMTAFVWPELGCEMIHPILQPTDTKFGSLDRGSVAIEIKAGGMETEDS